MTRTLRLGAREIGRGRPLYVMALAGDAHGGDVQLGYRLIETAGVAGANAIVLAAPGSLSARDFKSLLGQAQYVSMTALAMPRDAMGVELVASLDVPGLVVRDDETDLLRRAAAVGRPLVVWTAKGGPAMERILDVCGEAGNDRVAVLYDGAGAEGLRSLPDHLAGIVVPDGDERASAAGPGVSIIARSYALSDFAAMKAWVRELRAREAAHPGIEQGRP